MLLLMLISSDCRFSRCRLQFDRKLQSTSHQLARARYKQLLTISETQSVEVAPPPDLTISRVGKPPANSGSCSRNRTSADQDFHRVIQIASSAILPFSTRTAVVPLNRTVRP